MNFIKEKGKCPFFFFFLFFLFSFFLFLFFLVLFKSCGSPHHQMRLKIKKIETFKRKINPAPGSIQAKPKMIVIKPTSPRKGSNNNRSGQFSFAWFRGNLPFPMLLLLLLLLLFFFCRIKGRLTIKGSTELSHQLFPTFRRTQ